MRNRTPRILLAGAVAAVAVTACVIEVVAWTPLPGAQSAIQVNWTINGVAPTAAVCTSVGASQVQLFLDDPVVLPTCRPGEAGCGTHDVAWSWDCAAGTGTTGTVFAAQQVANALAVVSPEGRVLGVSTWRQDELRPGTLTLAIDWLLPILTGPDAAAVSTWTINDAAAGAASCASVGATGVSLTYRIAGSAADESMSWPCDSPSGTTGAIFRSGTSYELRWELRNAAGDVLSANPSATTWFSATMAAGDNPFTIPFDVVTGPDSAVVGTWTINGADATAALCGDALADRVYLAYRETGTVDERSMYWDCSAGSGTTEGAFDSGTGYDLKWDVRNAAGDVLSETAWTPITPVAGDNPVTVGFVVGGALDLTIRWADKVADPAYGSCTLPPTDVAWMGYLLESTTGAVIAEVDVTTAPATCSETLAWTNVPFATYHLEIDGRAASGPATWRADCVAVVVDDLTTNAFTCDVPMITAP